ncbi:TPA: hypothetical protein ACSUN1_000578 [Salmonella enterica subsp. diarizonae]
MTHAKTSGQKHRGKINGVTGQNDEMAPGATEAFRGAGLNVRDCAIAGVDGVSDAIHAVLSAEMVPILQDTKGQIQGSAGVAPQAVKGKNDLPGQISGSSTPETLNGMEVHRSTSVFRGPWRPSITLSNDRTRVSTVIPYSAAESSRSRRRNEK